MSDIGTQIDFLCDLQRGELSATETYQQALEKVGNGPWALPLRQIHDDHREAANTLRSHIHKHGGEPEQDSGAWGTWAKAVEGAAKVFGDTSALMALKTGEEYGLGQYESALQGDTIPQDCKEIIRTIILPQTRSHIETLDRLMNT